MTVIIKGRANAVVTPTIVSAITTPTLPTAATILPYKPSPKIDGEIIAIVGPTKTISSPISGATRGGSPATSAASTAEIKPEILAKVPISPASGVAGKPAKPAIPDYSHYTVSPSLPASISDLSLVATNRKHSTFNPLNDLAGMTNQRPVIAAITNFEPILISEISSDKGSSSVPFTRMGKHLFEQFFVRHLISENIDRLVKELRQSQNTSPLIGKLIGQFRGNFEKAFRPVTDLFNALNDIEELKKSFEFRRYAAINSSVFESYVHFDSFALASPKDVISVKISDIFTGDYHFNEASFRTFTNTKVMYQLLYELQHISKNSSYDLIRSDVTNHSSDSSPVSIVKNTTTSSRYAFGFFERYSKLTISLQKLQDLSKTFDVDSLSKLVVDAFSRITSELPTNLLDRVSLLSTLISKEYRTSAGIANPDFRKRFATYGFDIDSSQNVIDQLVGDIPDQITDILNPQPAGALTNLLQIIDGNVAILPFEQKYIDSSNGTYTPGSVYLADSILDDSTSKFSVSRLQKYLDAIGITTTALVDVMNSLKLINPAGFSAIGANRSDVFFVRTLAEILRSSFSNGDLSAGILVGTQNEVLIAAMSLAAIDEKLRSLLFILFTADQIQPLPSGTDLGKIIESSVLTASIINKISDRVFELMDAHKSAPSATYSGFERSPIASGITAAIETGAISIAGDIDRSSRDIGDEEFRSSLSGDQFVKMKTFFNNISADFAKNSCFDISDKTRFSHVNAEVLKLIVFQFVIDITSRFTFAKFSTTTTSGLRITNDNVRVANFRTLVDKLVVAPDMQQALQLTIAEEADAYDPQLRIIGRKLNDEELAVKKAYLSIFSTVSAVKNKASEIISLFSNTTGKYSRIFDEISSVVSPKLISIIDAAQIRLAVHQSQEILFHSDIATKTGKPVQFLDGAIVENDVIFALTAMCGEKMFQQAQAENMRILSVGLPTGFSKQLQERVNSADTKDNAHLITKQKDIVIINVYKKDLEFPDLVFKPQKFMFELSRFVSPVVSFDETLVKEDPSYGNFTSVLENVKTFDLTPDDKNSIDNSGQKGKASDIYTNSEYDFLNLDQKNSIVRNHVVSLLLEQYVRLLSGVTLNEQAFLINSGEDITLSTLPDEDILKQIIDNHVKNVAKLDNFDSTTDSIDALGLPDEIVNKLIHDMKHLSALAFSRTTLANPSGEIKRALTPKLFERIFNLPVDPDDFVIDVKKTTTTSFGNMSLNRLILASEVVEIMTPTLAVGVSPEVSYKLSEKNRKRGTVTLEQYFVTIETALGTEI